MDPIAPDHADNKVDVGIPKIPRRAFISGAALSVAGCCAAAACAEHASVSSSSTERLYGERSNCYWIENAGMEDAPLLGPLKADIVADVAIIGGGYTGLATALYLTEAFPKKKVVALEASRIGYGASGRNDGLVLPLVGGAEGIIDDLIEKGRIEEARKVFDKTSAGIGLIEGLIEEYGINCEWEPQTCLIGAVTESQVSMLEEERRRSEAIGLKSELLGSAELRRHVGIEGYRAAVTVPLGGMLDPAMLARGMIPALQSRGVSIFEGSRATEILPGSKITVRTPAGFVKADAIVLATNAYTSKLGYFCNRVIPVHSHNIATEPLSEKQIEELNWHGRCPIHDIRNFFELFRLTADNRIIHSGGDAFYYYNDGLGEEVDHPNYGRLRRAMLKRFPALESVAVTHRWCGHVGLTLDQTPTVGVAGSSKNVFYALGYSGHGVPVSFLAAKLICELYAGNPIDPAYSFFINRKPPAAPPEPLKSAGFALYKRYLHWLDSR